LAAASRDAWEPCAEEGQAVPHAGRSRFGFGMSWVEAALPSGASCSVAAFGVDPAPFIRKMCECLSVDRAADVVEMGVPWARCGTEGEVCSCSGSIRFGIGQRWVTADRSQLTSSATPCGAASFEGQDPQLGITKECWCEQRPDSVLEAPPRDRVAVVMLSRRPPDLKLWLQYHIGHMGVDHVFMQVEDTPTFNATFESIPHAFRQKVTVWRAAPMTPVAGSAFEARPPDDYETLQRRQVSAMSLAKQACQQMGINWLLHIDDDELLYAPFHRPVGEILSAMPGGFDQAYIPNTEAVYPSADVRSCFSETSEFNVNVFTFNSYANGKAAVRASDVVAVPAGPHQWRDSQGHELPSIHLDREPFGPPLMVVHFESCPFSRWEDKFWELGNTAPSKVQQIPFRFYRESIERMQRCRAASGQQQSFLASGDVAPECSEASLKQFWASWKTERNPAITPKSLMPLRIPWRTIASLQV